MLQGSRDRLLAMTTAAPETHRVLVVDDEPNIVDVVSMALRFQGFDVELGRHRRATRSPRCASSART